MSLFLLGIESKDNNIFVIYKYMQKKSSNIYEGESFLSESNDPLYLSNYSPNSL